MNSQQKLALALAALAAVAAPAGALTPVRVAYGGHVSKTTAPVVQLRQGTLVPLRPVVMALGGRMAWDEASRIAIVRYRGRRLEVDGQRRALRLDGQPLHGLIAPCAQRGQLLVPLAAIERLFGVHGRWQPLRSLLSFAALPGGGGAMARAPGGKESGPTGAGVTQNPRASGGLALLLDADRQTYALGTPVILRLTVINTSRAPVTLQFASGQHYDFEVRRAGETVWRWSAGRMFTQAVTSLTLRPRERQVFTETWGQQDNHGQPVPAGTYEAVAVLTTMARPRPQSPPLALRIGS